MENISHYRNIKSKLLWFVVVQAVLFVFQATLLVASTVDSAKYYATMADIEMLENYIDAFKSENGRYPLQEEGLQILYENTSNLETWNGPYIPRKIPRDPWGNDYVYLNPAKYGDKPYDIYSFGVNQEDDQGLKDDITNWSEINIEYYGGMTSTKKYSFMFIMFGIFTVATLCLFLVDKPSLTVITIRFARCSLIAFFMLIAFFVIIPARINGDSVFKAIIFWTLFTGWSGCSIFGTVVGVISMVKNGFILKQLTSIAICLIPWLAIGVAILVL